jgi:hypothetical protein
MTTTGNFDSVTSIGYAIQDPQRRWRRSTVSGSMDRAFTADPIGLCQPAGALSARCHIQSRRPGPGLISPSPLSTTAALVTFDDGTRPAKRPGE